MDKKMKRVLKFIFWFCVFGAVGLMVQTIRHPTNTEPQNKIIYNVVDDDGHVIGGFILKK